MKILHVIDRLNVGGAEKVMVYLTSLLADHNINIAVLLFNEGFPLEQELDPKLKKHILNRKNKFSIKKLWQANRICSRYDIIHVHMRHNYAYMRLAQFLFGGKYIIILHDHFFNTGHIHPALKGFIKPKYYIGVSRSLVKWAKDALGIDPSNIFLLPNTIVPKTLSEKEGQSQTIIVSNLSAIKNIEFGIELCNYINEPLIIYGNNAEAEYANRIMALAEKANVRIMSGISDVSTVFNSKSFALHCSKAESGPLVLLEYLAYGVPFLAYNTGEVAETVSGELPLHFIDSFDMQAWADRIRQIKAQGDISEKLKAVFNKYFDPKKYVQQCLNIYQTVRS